MTIVLPGAPWLVAHRSMLSLNKPYKITLNSQDYVLWQNTQGEIFALENICPHMQAPLSEGWICESRNSIACPFHALEFNGNGQLLKDGEPNGQAIAKTLELVVQGDLIWTYGGFDPRLPIPDLISRRTKGLSFLGVAGEKSIHASFLSCIKINYDFNHQNGSHRASFKIRENPIHTFEEDGYRARVELTFLREDNTLSEILENPALFSIPKSYRSELEYSFPSTTMFRAEVDIGHVPQFFILYPETEHRTKTFVLCYGKWKNPLFQLPGINAIARRSLMQSTAKVVEQDLATLESLYPLQKPRIRLPREEIMTYVERLYSEW
ncbi:MAG: Rieske 2Fe-2S domain-containing protein [Alkalinema sp. RU_4_3]|nr:Rieske 2Fe-2S domain-containing protein [Alkalinema sp. RU_4_3]NJM98550.1 Rieske 2Fe-2S domain-containing protein [Phormidesmis sp. RL_2_1]